MAKRDTLFRKLSPAWNVEAGARSEAQAVHGLEIRTELGFGDVAGELTRRLIERPDQLLILGVSDISVLTQRFAVLLSRTASPLLVVWQPSDAPQQY